MSLFTTGLDRSASPSNHGSESQGCSIVPSSPSESDIDFSTLNSFIPILKHLPGLYLDENLYYIRGPITIDDWTRLRDRTLTVSKFILTDVTEGSEECISPAAYFRLALSQEPGTPFFPHLYDLIIADADTSLAYLELLLTPSLTSLEVSRIPNAKQPTLSSFLITLAQVAPLLQILSFGPGQFSWNSIQTILQFKNLRHLELRNAVSKMDFTFLESLGSSSPALESLILDARSCEYIPNTAIMEHTTHTPYASFGTEPMDGKNDEESPQSDTSDVGAFSQLMKLHIIGSPLFLGDLILQIASTRLEDVFITAVVSREVLKMKRQREAAEADAEREGERERGRGRGRGRGISSEIFKLGIREEEMDIRLEELEGESEEERRMRAINEQKKAREANNMLFSTANLALLKLKLLLKLLPTRWSTSLKTISVVKEFGHPPHQVPIPPTLLNEAFQLLLFHPTIENFTVKGWTPDSVEDSILGLAKFTPSNLKNLFLPLDEENSWISWSTLRHIAITCPKLQSLQCRINPLSPIPKYTVPTTDVLFHELRTLSLGNSFPNLHSNELYLIARHLDLLFPHLETITALEHDEEAEPWIVVNELVKICQTARMDERYRATMQQRDGKHRKLKLRKL